MARADLLKRLFTSYQERDDPSFRAVASAIVDEERKKHHPVLANQLQRILNNGSRSREQNAAPFDPVPTDNERRTPLVTIKQPDRYIHDLVLDEATEALVRRIMREFIAWDILEANGLAPATKVLFCGPSGCGKTASAEAVATEIGLPLLYVRFDSVVSSLLGETAANLRKVFSYAERGQWVLFFDEFDAIGRSRDDVTEHGEIKRVVNSFLQLLDNFKGRSLVIAATNFEQALDPAIWRRFDDVIRLELPTASMLRELIGKKLVSLKSSEEQKERLVSALEDGSFADAERACLDILRTCALEGSRTVRDADVCDAIDRRHYRRKVLGHAITRDRSPAVDQQ